jgi:MFS family permease
VAPAHEGGGARINLRALYQQSPFGLVAAFLCGVTASAFFTLGPVFAQLQGLDTRGVAAFMAFGTLGGFLMAWPVGWLSDRFDRRFVIIGAALTATASLFTMMALVPEEPSGWILYLCVAIFGGTIVPTYSVVMAHVNDAVGEGEFVAALERSADHARRWRGGWAFACGVCHVGFEAWPGIHAHCDADPHGRFWSVSLDTPGSSGRDA